MCAHKGFRRLWIAAVLLAGVTACGQDAPVSGEGPVATSGGTDALLADAESDTPVADATDATPLPDVTPDVAEDALADVEFDETAGPDADDGTDATAAEDAEDGVADPGPDGAGLPDVDDGTDAVAADESADAVAELDVETADDAVTELDSVPLDDVFQELDVAEVSAPDAVTVVDVLTDASDDAFSAPDTADGEIDAADSGCGSGGCLVPDTPCDATHPCTAGVCDPATLTCVGCVSSADCAGGWCDNHACVSALPCQSDSECKASSLVCDKKQGLCVPCVATADCLGQGVCIADHCVPVLTCASSLQCPAGQICDGGSGTCVACSQTIDCKAGEFCNTDHACQAFICSEKACVADSVFACKSGGDGYLPSVSCDDGNSCTTDACKLPLGCTHVPVSGVCDDGDACTLSDTCTNGICAGTWNSCDDGLVCTTDSCASDTGCHHASYAGACDDGSVCTKFDSCATGACGGQLINCDDGLPCTDDSCNATIGCAHLANAATCTDANICTQGDTCQGGQCGPGGQLDCTDSDPCTADSCQATSGCIHAKLSGPACDDGDVCTSSDICVGGACGGVPVICSDNNPCTADSCPAKVGCTFVANSAACEDGDVCSVNDVCAGGTCQAGTTKVCNDGNPCTADVCVTMIGCEATPVSGPACEDGNLCTQGDTCGAQGCEPGSSVSCDDSDKCTADACVPTTGCVHTPAINPCDDGSACTIDLCSANTCSHKSSSLGLWTSGGVLDDAGAGLVVDSSGGTAVLGTTRSSGAGGSDFWLQYVNAKGDTLWTATKGGTGDDTGLAMAARVGGGYWLAGKTTTGSFGSDDAWLLAVDAQGATVADVKAGTAANDVFAAVASLADGGAVVAGTRGAGASGLGGTDAWVTRVSGTGMIAWTVPVGLLGGSGNDAATAVTVAANGDILVAWAFDKSASGKGFDAWATRLSSTGAVIWSAAVADLTVPETPRTILEAADGSIVLAGDVVTAPGNTDAWVARLMPTGERLWLHSYGNSAVDTAAAISEVHGGFAFVGATTNPANGKTDGWLVRIDGDGNLICSETYGGGADDSATALQALPDGRFAWVGTTASSGAGGADVWRVLVDAWGHADCTTAGVCLTLTLADCDDSTSCTADACDAVSGCTHVAGSTACSDGNACTQGDTCKGLVCNAGTTTVCDDNDPCTTDVCDPKLGCYHTTAPTGTACSDKNACTVGDYCQNRQCVSGGPTTCTGGNSCQYPSCDPNSGCKLANKPDGVNCGSYTCGLSTCYYLCSGGACK